MPFERFDKRSVPITESPFVTIQMRGPMSFNYSAYKALGEPEAVELLYDAENHMVGFRPASPKEAYAFALRPQGRKDKRPSNFIVAGQAFTKHYGIDTSVAQRYPVEMQGDVLTVDLKRGTVATGPRLKGKDGAKTQ